MRYWLVENSHTFYITNHSIIFPTTIHIVTCHSNRHSFHISCLGLPIHITLGYLIAFFTSYTVPFYYFIFLHTIFQISYSPSPSSFFFSILSASHWQTSSPYHNSHPCPHISICKTLISWTFFHLYILFLPIYIMKTIFHACLPTSLIPLQTCFFQNFTFTFIPNFTIQFRLTSLNQIRFTNSISPNILHVCLHRDCHLACSLGI